MLWDMDVTQLNENTNAPSILKLPAEILLEVLSLLSVADLLSFRETCTHIDSLSRDRSVWLAMLLSQHATMPVPPPYDHDPARLTRPLDANALSQLVLSICHTECSWLLARSPPIPIVTPESPSHADVSDLGGRHAILMETIADRWLLSIYDEGTVYIWDLYVDGITPASTYRRAGLTPKTRCCFSLQLPIVDRLSSAFASLSQDYTTLHVAVVSQTDCTILDLRLPTSRCHNITSDGRLQMVADRSWKLPGPALTVRALDPPSNLAFLSYSDTLVLLHWESGKLWQMRTIEHMNEDEFWTGVIAARFVSSHHILCIKTHALELLTLPSTFLPEQFVPDRTRTSSNDSNHVGHLPTRVHSHFLSGLTFRGVSMSEVQLSQDGTHARVSFLAYDILRGLYHYRINILLLPPATDNRDTPHILADSPPPQITVRLLAVHRLAQLYSLGGTSGSAPRGRSGFTPGSRGFVSACVLGRTGRRGVWVERKRGSMRRSVIAFKAEDDVDESEECVDGDVEDNVGPQVTDVDWTRLRLSDDDDEDTRDKTVAAMEERCAKPIDGRVLFELNSYDLRDDITHCAFAESTGTVILGNRKGELKLL